MTAGTSGKLPPELRTVLLGALDSYLNAPALENGHTPAEVEAELDAKRVAIIETTLAPLLQQYLAGSVSLSEFKRRIDGMNKQNPLWGFSGIKGQMFFNMLVRTVADASELDGQLKAAIRSPADEPAAAHSLKTFTDFVSRIGREFLEAGGDTYSRARPGSVPFFLSYFWQIQRREVWPVYYTNSVQAMEAMNLFQETGEASDDYIGYKRVHESLAALFSEAAGRPFSLYDVEHVFWFRSGKLSVAAPPPVSGETGELRFATGQQRTITREESILADGYVPPIVEIIPMLAANEPATQELVKNSGTKVERALEKSIHAAFTILGYETRLLGQGMGRVPDGQAIALDESYAILWDAKARADGYRMGTDDRAIRQYIDTQSRIIKRARGVRNIYYLIVSSKFADDFDDLIRSVKMETNVNEVCLLEADALVSIVDQKLRAPLEISLGPDGIQRLFSSSGIINAIRVAEALG
jgi:hypothetical protein